jgi:hypothetical protein
MLTCEHGDFVGVIELAISLAIKCRPQVCNKDLRSLQEAHFLALKCALVSEAWELLSEQVDKTCCGALCIFDECDDATVEFLVC